MNYKYFYMKKTLVLIIVLLIPAAVTCQSQNDTLFISFWNLQNLFDTIDDPLKDDEEFLPSGKIEWTLDRLEKKMYNHSRVLRLMNDGKGPDLLGVCEVENQAVLDSMVNKFLPDLNYKTAYLESPDNRGIDNGLIFKSEKFKLLNVQADTVHLSDGWPTRLIFGVNLLTNDNKKITVFVNHWPSRSGGQLESEPNRIAAAKTLRDAVDRIFLADSNANIFIVGDFNDDPVNVSILETLRAQPIRCDSLSADFEIESRRELFNLSYADFEKGEGSFKYKDTWNMLDQIIVSASPIIGNEFNYICNSFEIFKPELIVTKSGQYQGTPFPTYGGSRYLGGYSDHFPVFAKFKIHQEPGMRKELLIFGSSGALGNGVTEAFLKKNYDKIYLFDFKHKEIAQTNVKQIIVKDLSVEENVKKVFSEVSPSKESVFFLFSTMVDLLEVRNSGRRRSRF